MFISFACSLLTCPDTSIRFDLSAADLVSVRIVARLKKHPRRKSCAFLRIRSQKSYFSSSSKNIKQKKNILKRPYITRFRISEEREIFNQSLLMSLPFPGILSLSLQSCFFFHREICKSLFENERAND